MLWTAYVPQVDAVEQHRQVHGLQLHGGLAGGHFRQFEASNLEPFCKEAQPAGLPEQNLEVVLALADENEEVTRKRVLRPAAANRQARCARILGAREQRARQL